MLTPLLFDIDITRETGIAGKGGHSGGPDSSHLQRQTAVSCCCLQRRWKLRPLATCGVTLYVLFSAYRADDKTLQDYNVAAGGTIHKVLQLRGGC